MDAVTRNNGPQRRLFKLGVLTSLVAAAGVVAGAAFFMLDPVGFRLVVFQPVREVRFFHNELGGLGELGKVRRVELPPAARIEIGKSALEDIRIAADLYSPPPGPNTVPALIVLHGSSPYGRKVGLVRLLGTMLSDRGWIVLAPDARGFGETDDPVAIDDPDAWAVGEDIERVIDHLSGLPRVDHGRILVLGHSVGVGHALQGALHDPRVKGLILVGPSANHKRGKGSESVWRRTRFAADRGLQEPVSVGVLEAGSARSDLARYVGRSLAKTGHVPVLIVQGQGEGEAARRLVADLVEDIAPPVTHEILPATGHYVGVRSFLGSPVVYYRPDLFKPFEDLIVEFSRTRGLENGKLTHGDTGSGAPGPKGL